MMRARGRAGLLGVALVASAALAVVPATSGGSAVAAPGAAASTTFGASTVSAGPVLAARRSKRTDKTQVQKVKVKWKGSRKRKPTYQKTAVIPGIGDLDLVCRPNKTMIRLYTANRSLETQMWLQKYETKNSRYVVSVKTPRVYTYAHADDNGKGGTGFYTHEGLNQEPGIENRSQDGYMYGVISQRPGRQQSGTALDPLRPVTTFELKWNWNGFDYDQEYRSCKIKGVFTTQFPDEARTTLTWRGDDDSAPTEVTGKVPGIGWLTMTCPHDLSQDPTVSIDPYSDNASLYIEDVEGEGLVENQRVETSLPYDAETGLLGPYPLPENGTLRMQAKNKDNDSWIMLSSYYVRNDDKRPQRNLCEQAAGYYDR